MNLTTTPWIPVIQKEGTKGLVSLFNLFSKGKEIRNLAVNPPHRIALMRFLICVVQAALDGPEDEAHWIKCSENLGEEAIEYLKKWKDQFDLYGATPFMQIPGLFPTQVGMIQRPGLLHIKRATFPNTWSTIIASIFAIGFWGGDCLVFYPA